MSSTKIINVLKDDRFEELLDIVKNADASEIIFVLPKKTKAFGSEEQFDVLSKEVKEIDKSVAFLCSNPEVNDLARKYKFDVLSVTNEARAISHRIGKKTKSRILVSEVSSDDSEPLRPGNELGEDPAYKKYTEKFENTEKSDEEEEKEDYKEEEGSEEEENEEPLYGTETDESGEIVYDEKDENPTDQISAEANNGEGFQIITAKSKANAGLIKIKARKDSSNIKNIFSSLGKRSLQHRILPEASNNIWSDIIKPSTPKSSVLNKFRLYKKGGLTRKTGFNYIKFPRGWAGLLSLATILILVLVVYFTTGSAKVEIKPRAQKLNTQIKIRVSPNFSSTDSLLNRIPGQLFTINKSITKEFNATAEKDAAQKSRGVITIYNEYSTSPQPLVATTRFEFIGDSKTTPEGSGPRSIFGRESGLVFRTLKTINVPGMKVENGVISPGKIAVEVIADKAGQNYNIPAGKFGIVSWREKGDTARYQKIYGQSDESMHGGILGKAKVVSEFDYENAKNQLVSKIKAEISDSLKSQSAGLEIINSVEPSVDSVKSTAETDDTADSFTMTVESSLIMIGFKKDDLMSLISQYVDKTNNLMTVPEKLELSYKNASVNSATNTLEFLTDIKGNAYGRIDKEDIADNLRGKNEIQIKEYFNSLKEEVDSAKVVLSPFWVKKIPKNKGKINISLIY